MHTRDIHKILLKKKSIKQQSLINTVGKCIRTELTKKTKNQKNTRFNVSDCQELTFFIIYFFFDLSSARNMVRVIEGKII